MEKLVETRKKAAAKLRIAEKTEKTGFVDMVLMFFIFSIAGQLMEEVWCFVIGVRKAEGYFSLPISPIYGICVLLIYFIVRTPQSGLCGNIRTRIAGGGESKFRSALASVVSVGAYFVIAALITSAIELFTGMFFDLVLDVKFWDYSGMPFNFHGYIVLSNSLAWGLLVTVVMGVAWPFIQEKVLGRIPYKYKRVAAGALSCLFFVDFLSSTAYYVRRITKL